MKNHISTNNIAKEVQPENTSDHFHQVVPQFFTYNKPFTFTSGSKLPSFQLIYETYGERNADSSNAVLVCHALSGNHHAAGFHSPSDTKAGWWDNFIGPGKPIDTTKFFVVCVNNLGGCDGSTGPISINPETNEMYGSDFPLVTVSDWVKSQKILMDYLRISKWFSVVGPSLGGMQALQWAIDYPDKLGSALIIAAASKLSAQNIAFNEIARRAITSDKNYHDGYYAKHSVKPKFGVMLARMIGHVTYLSDSLMHTKFGRNKKERSEDFSYKPEFMVETYLNHQAKRFSDVFDANTYLLMTRALDYYDPAASFDNNLTTCLESTSCNFLIISFSSDWRFSPAESEKMVKALLQAGKNVSYACITSDKGHDSFLLQNDYYHQIVKNFLQMQRENCGI